MKNLILLSTTMLLIIMVAIPYYSVANQFNFTRDIREAIHNANRPEYFFFSSDRSRLQQIFLDIFYKNDKGPYFYDGYLGFGLLALGTFSISYLFLHKRKSKRIFEKIFLTISLLSFIVSLGPVFQWGGHVIKKPFMFPLPYALLYYIIPGFKGMRNSARWEMLSVFTLSVFIGLVLSRYLRNKHKTFKLLFTIAFCLIIFLEFNLPYHFSQLPVKEKFPKVYSYISSLPSNTVIIELPWYNWDMLPYSHREHIRLYFSTLHFKNMVNGGSGFSPPIWQNQARWFMLTFPDKASIKLLKNIHVRYIIIHKNEFETLYDNKFKVLGKRVSSWKEIQEKLQTSSGIKLEKIFGNDFIYKVI